jgi:hypothetical protein
MTSGDFIDQVKNTAVVLTSLSGAAYACGYVAVRARARAIGADPGFALVDQAYVFAGFRFVVVLLLSLLIAAPVLLGLRWLAARALLMGAGPLLTLEWSGTVVAGAATLWAYLATTGVNGVLLVPSSDWAAAAALGRNAFGFLFTFGATAATAALLLWSRAHLARAGRLDALGSAIALVTGLLVVLLPVEHGVFHADRTARRLDGAPQGLGGLAAPIWVVDRTADRVTLFGRDRDGRPRLVTVKADRLDGVAVVRIGSLSDVVGDMP